MCMYMSCSEVDRIHYASEHTEKFNKFNDSTSTIANLAAAPAGISAADLITNAYR